jgi:thymidylate kinase
LRKSTGAFLLERTQRRLDMCARTERLIAFSGIDGTGKTTLARRISELSAGSGAPYLYVYGRYQPFLAKPIWAIMKRIFFPPIDPRRRWTEYEREKRVRLRNPVLRFLHSALIAVDYLLQMGIRITLPLLVGRRIVCDRYVSDTVISDLAPDLGYTDAQIRSAIRFFHLFLPRPGLLFLLDVPEEISLARKNDVPAPSYLTERRRMYALLRSEVGVVVLDGARPLEENLSDASAAALRLAGEKP